MLKQFKDSFQRNMINLPGWRTPGKIVVFESDDWGSIRMPNPDVYNIFLKSGYSVDKIAYEKFDSLASEDDLELLFGTLTKFKDSNGNSPVITANTIMANPDFERIRNSGFTNYYYEHFTETLKKYAKHSNSFKLWKEGINNKIFYPQYHGREHLNVSKFMKALRDKDTDAHFAFNHSLPGSMPHGLPPKGNKYVEATRYISEKDKWEKLDIFLEGYKMFTDTFGYKSKTVIPTNYTWSADWDEKAAAAGIKYYQGNPVMKEPVLTVRKKDKLHRHYLGQENKFGQKYLIRNAIFEPSLFRLKVNNPVDECLKQIETAFRWKKPAIVTSHRINYIGYLDESNRDKNLKLFEELISRIVKKWPDTEFHNSESLANLIDKS